MILANMPAEEYSDYISKTQLVAKTAHTIVDKDELDSELNLIRKRGYALSNEEYIPGLNAIAAPLINFRKNSVIGAVSFDVPALNFPVNLIESKYADAIKKTGMDLSEMITVADD